MTRSSAPSAGRGGRLAHAVADHLAAAELRFVAVDGEVLLDLDEKFGVREADAVARGRAEHVRILLSVDSRSHPMHLRSPFPWLP